MNNQNVFKKIYHENTWGDPESKSGSGSNLRQTELVREKLPVFLDELNIKTLLDIPCGDFYWINLIKPELSKVLSKYIGGDLVSELIEENEKHHSNDKFSFKVLDLKESDLPKTDLILCRDCLVHLSYTDIIKCFRNIKRSKSKYLLTTTFPEHENRNIVTGAWRPINLCAFPFKMKAPEKTILENCSEGNGSFGDKSLALWKIKDINITLMLFNHSIHKAKGLYKLLMKKNKA